MEYDNNHFIIASRAYSLQAAAANLFEFSSSLRKGEKDKAIYQGRQ
jgi:hypothetical protein